MQSADERERHGTEMNRENQAHSGEEDREMRMTTAESTLRRIMRNATSTAACGVPARLNGHYNGNSVPHVTAHRVFPI